MGFLIFAYRKLYLKNKINELGYQALLLSQKKQTITSQINMAQQAMSAGKESIGMFANSEMSQLQQSIYDKYGKMDKNNGQFKFNEGMDNTGMNMELNNGMQVLQQKYAYANSIFAGQEEGMLRQLNSIDTQISNQLAAIDTQMKQLQPELDNVEKAEDAAAKSEAPKFGLS